MPTPHQNDPHGFLLKFEDGPLAKRVGFMLNDRPVRGVLNVSPEDFVWPLPDLLAVATADNIVAIWNAVTGIPRPDGATAQFFYQKVAESDCPAGGAEMVRGAHYRMSLAPVR